MNSRILIDGREHSQIDVRDRGLHYGDGLFETLAVIDGGVRRLEAHLTRLEKGCARLGFKTPQRSILESEIAQLAHGVTRGVIKLIVTRGLGQRGYRPPAEVRPSRTVLLSPWPDYPDRYREEGVTIRLCTTPLGDSPALAGMKHLNRLEQVLARSEWTDPAIAEGLMLDVRGAPICGTMSNLFVVNDGIIRTPQLDRGGVVGTMRGAILEAAPGLELGVEETSLSLGSLFEADEIFLTNALIGIWPVRRLEQREYSIGPVTRRLQREVI